MKTDLHVDLVLSYFAHELASVVPARLQLFKSENGTAGPWQWQAAAQVDPAASQVHLADVTSFSTWTLGNQANPLPVELVTFTATTQAGGVRLTWRTASEYQSAYFTVERSRDGRRFDPVGQVAAAGTSLSAHTYAYWDATAPSGLLYYRLRQVDQPGTSAYSPVRTVTLATAELALSPNPARTQVRLRGAAAVAPVHVLDALGREVLTAATDANGQAELVLPVGLAGGVYVVRCSGQAQRLVVN